MELIFVRHGQGEHGLDLPGSLDREHPRLTAKGRDQVANLAGELAITDGDLLVVSPTRRTVETALILAEATNARRCVSPLVGPRMFHPSPKGTTLPCDRLLDVSTLHREYPELEILEPPSADLWNDGINRIGDEAFRTLGTSLLGWCLAQARARVVIVAHDGTVHNYRRLLGETALTRADALGEAGWHRMSLASSWSGVGGR